MSVIVKKLDLVSYGIKVSAKPISAKHIEELPEEIHHLIAEYLPVRFHATVKSTTCWYAFVRGTFDLVGVGKGDFGLKYRVLSPVLGTPWVVYASRTGVYPATHFYGGRQLVQLRDNSYRDWIVDLMMCNDVFLAELRDIPTIQPIRRSSRKRAIRMIHNE